MPALPFPRKPPMNQSTREHTATEHRRTRRRLHPEPKDGTNALAIVSLTTGIASWVIIPFIGGLAAVITGHIARSQIRKSGEAGGPMALIGLIFGYLNILIFIIGIAAAIMLPAYAEYVQRSKIKTALATLETHRPELLHGQPENQAIALTAQTSPYWESIKIENGVLTAKFANSQAIPKRYQGETFAVRAVPHNGQTEWQCVFSLSVAPRQYPEYCSGDSPR